MKKIYPMKRIAAGCMALCIAFAAFGFSDGSVSDIALADNDTYSSQLEELKKQQQELDKQIADADKKLADEQDKYLRLAAEYDNYRKRTAKEKESLYADAKIDTIKALLGVYDNLERGLAQYGDEESPHRKGLEMVFNQFKESLKKLGVETMDAAGKPFDPEKHNAVMPIKSSSKMCGTHF